MQVFLRGVRSFVVCGGVALSLAGGTAAQPAFAPQPTPVVAAIDAGGGPYTKVYEAPNCFQSTAAPGCQSAGWLADYDFTLGGVHVAVGDVTGDGKWDVVTVPGKGGRADIRAFTGSGTQELSFYTDWFNGGHSLALGDVNGDGRLDYVLGNEDWGGPLVQVLDGRTGRSLGSFDTGSGGSNGVRVAAGDVGGDGRAQIVTANAGGLEPRISIWPGVPSSNPHPLRSFLAFDPSASGGVEVAVGDLNGDGRADIAAIASGAQGPELRVFDGLTLALLTDCYPFTWAVPDSLGVAIGDIDGDRKPDLVVAGDTASGPQIEELSATCGPIASFAGLSRGEHVAVGDVTGDGKPDLIVGDGPSADAHVTVLSANAKLESSLSPYGPSFMNGGRIAAGDFTGDGGTEVVTGQGPGGTSEVDLFDPSGAEGALLLVLHPFAGSGSDGAYVAAGDVDGDGHADIVAGADAGGEPRVSVYDRTGKLVSSFLAFEPDFRGGVRVAVGDVDGDGKAEIIAGSGPGRPAELRIFTASGTLLRAIVPFSPFFQGGVFPAAGDLNGDGRAEIAVGAGSGGDGLVRSFDADGAALARFQPYGETAREVRVAIGDVLTPGVGQIVTASGRIARATVDIFDPQGSPAGSILSEDIFGGGLFVGVQEPTGPALQASPPPVSAVEGRPASLVLPVTDPAGKDTSGDVAASARWGGASMPSGSTGPAARSCSPAHTPSRPAGRTRSH